MADQAQRIVDLLIDCLMRDKRFPRMSFLAWVLWLRPLQLQLNDIIDEIRKESATDDYGYGAFLEEEEAAKRDTARRQT
jgi:hypothetical protein